MAEGNGNNTPKTITVSTETLRAELATLKLELLEKLATRESVAALESRMTLLERTALVQGGPIFSQVTDIDKRVNSIEHYNIEKLAEIVEDQEKKIDGLQQDKAGREAIVLFKNRLIGAGVITTLVLTIQAILSFYIAFKHH